MAKTANEIMDELAERTADILDKQFQPGTAIYWGDGKDQNDTWLWVLMVEAHKAGKSPALAKLAYLNGDIEEVDTGERMNRLAAACSYASNW
jgi:hypothetical protein